MSKRKRKAVDIWMTVYDGTPIVTHYSKSDAVRCKARDEEVVRFTPYSAAEKRLVAAALKLVIQKPELYGPNGRMARFLVAREKYCAEKEKEKK